MIGDTEEKVSPKIGNIRFEGKTMLYYEDMERREVGYNAGEE